MSRKTHYSSIHGMKYVAQGILLTSILCMSIEAQDVNADNINELSVSPIIKPVSYAKPQPSALSAMKQKSKAPVPSYKEGRVIVKYKSGSSAAQISSMASNMGLNVVKTYTKLSKKNPISVIESSQTTEEMVKLLKADPNVESVSPDYIRQLDSVPNDPDFSQLWGMNNTGQTGGTSDADIDAVEAWDVTTGSSNIVAVVFDTGIDYRHEDLMGNVWVNTGEIPGDGVDNDGNGYVDDVYGYDVAADDLGNNDGDPLDIHGHGTHVSGTIGANGNDGYGISGINWDVSILVVKVFRPDLGAYDSDILEAIEYVLTMKARGVNIVTINASYGGTGGSQGDAMNAAIKSLGDAGIIFCAAAGNDGTDNDAAPHFPSSYDAANLISVAASDHNDEISSFSNYGLTSVDLSAPGSAIYSTLPGVFSSSYEPQEGDPYFVSIDGSESWNVYSSDITNWEQTTQNTHSAPYALTDSLSGNYSDDLITQIWPQTPIDLTVMADADLAFGFWATLDIEEGWDYLRVYFSADGGANWTLMQSFDGESKPMQAYSIPIPAAFQTNNFLYAFSLETDCCVNYDGATIDDIGIGLGSTSYTGTYASWDGTSMATPHVTGAVALLSGAYPGITVAGMKARILENVDPLNTLDGKVVTGGRLNLKNAMGTGGVCPVGQHFKQGTLECITDTVPEIELPYLPEYNGLIQGTMDTDPTSSLTDFSLSLPSCPEGDTRVQGTDVCIAPEI